MKNINNVLAASIKVWNKLNNEDKDYIINNSKIITYNKGEVIHKGDMTCLGLIIIINGSLRAYLSSENGKQITLYKLYNNDICLFSASCVMNNIDFEVFLECEEDTEVILLPTDKYKIILDKSIIFKDYINDVLASSFSDVMWIFEQFVFQSLDKRLANYLLDQNKTDIITTHEKIANELGSAREVISRMLKYFENENIIKIERNKISIIDINKLNEIIKK